MSTSERDIRTRWGNQDAILREGFVGVPVSFLKYGSQLGEGGLSPAEAMLVLQLMVHKWSHAAPYPGYKSLARRMGISIDYARKLARSLEAKGLLKRKRRLGGTNRFDLTPLFERLNSLAATAAEVIDEDDTYDD